MTAPAARSADDWILLGLERGPSDELLARSPELLEEAGNDGRPRIRWYVSTDEAIVLGRGQRDAKPVSGHTRLQRHSGGGAVLMDAELLSCDVVLPAGHPWLDDADLGAVFAPIGAAWMAAMSDLGVHDLAVHTGAATASRLGPEPLRPLAEVCYASLGKGEVIASGRKLVGLSQRRRQSGALIQCGIHRTWRPGPLIEALDVEVARDAIEAAAVGIDDLLTPPVSDASIVRAVQDRLLAADR